ncbi:MAG: hypothetical protein O2894_02375 [Planctomycetota bacterium]|nr:hypothetical protein [Planctomycetota bacterium]
MSPRTRWIVLASAALLATGLVLTRGHAPEPEVPPGPVVEEIRFPMPDSEPEVAPTDQARGIYRLVRGADSFTLDLRGEGRFRFVSARGGRPVLEAEGNWSLAQSRLTLAYTHVSQRPDVTPENPQVAVNVWRGKTIELLDTGESERVILTKRTALRER